MGWKFVFNGTGLIVVLIKLLSNILVVFVAVGFRALQANTELKKEVLERRNFQIQAELEQLKSQLNPHFLFNTLNNISSLSTFDTDATQLSISKLSDMLRYVIYDTTSPKVELKKEIDFIMNYVDLMKLRYDESTLSVNVSVNVANMQCKIAPMLYISIVENAFKYGASSKVNSSIDIDVSEDDSAITFVVTNTLLKDSEVNNAHKGGVGISNLKKRLDIIYPACYEYTYGLTDDGKYRASIKLFNQKKV
jgi:LytS/YehU family sensor histidine kinase